MTYSILHIPQSHGNQLRYVGILYFRESFTTMDTLLLVMSWSRCVKIYCRTGAQILGRTANNVFLINNTRNKAIQRSKISIHVQNHYIRHSEVEASWSPGATWQMVQTDCRSKHVIVQNNVPGHPRTEMIGALWRSFSPSNVQQQADV